MQSIDPKNIHAIFFDVDSTLFDKEVAHKKALNTIMKKHDLFDDIDFSELYDAFKKSDEKCVVDFDDGVPMDKIRWKRSKRFLKAIDVPEKYTETLHQEFQSTYPCVGAEIEGAVETVRKLYKDYELDIITNSTRETQFKKLDTLNIKKYFDEFIFSEEVDSRKPDRKIFLKAIDKVDENPENCVYVGDSFRRDVIGAKKAGMKTCWFNKDNRKKIKNERPDLEISELKQLLDIF
ncbi:MAG: HAD family hydrolase [Thermoplasmata archaeon]